ECDVLSGLGPLCHPGRADDLPGLLLVPHIDRDLVAMLGQELAHPLLGGVLGFENFGRQRPFILHPPFDLEAHETPPLFPARQSFSRACIPLTSVQTCWPFSKNRAWHLTLKPKRVARLT